MKLKRHFRITKEEIALAFAITTLSLVLTLRPILFALNVLNPFEGLIVYYLILYGSLIALSHFGLVIFNVKIKDPLQTFGLLLITFSFFIAVGLSSAYIQYVTTGNAMGASNIYYQCEDGATVYLWNLIIPMKLTIAGVNLIWLLSYGFTPFILTIFGSLFVFKKPRLGT